MEACVGDVRMNAPDGVISREGTGGRGGRMACAAVIAAATAAAYANCYRVPFVYDDPQAIVENASLRTLWPPWGALFSAPPDGTVGGRPIANLTLAVNYALSGTGVWSYHALNVLIHVLAALTLFGLVRRTLARPPLSVRLGRDSESIALAAALLWAVHPLQTESVTYVVQRVESLMGLFYLLTLYCFARSVDSPRATAWQIGSAAACLLGMATKETMATAPLAVLLYDRTFVAGTFMGALRRRRGLYAAYAVTWLPLAGLVATTGWNRGRSAGFNAGVAPGVYWLTQLEAVARYAALCFWPRPLVFDYGPFRRHLADVAPYAAVVALIVGATLVALRRRPGLGFLGAWFLLVLAPSSVVPVATQTMAEHRMYLPLAAVAVGVAVGLHARFGRRSWAVLLPVILVLGWATVRRNEVYASDLSLWTDTVGKRPDNAIARNNLGLALFTRGRVPEAIEQYRAGLTLLPGFPGLLNNLGNALDKSGNASEAIGMYEAALRLEPGFVAAHYNLGAAYDRAGRIREALDQYEEVAKLRPDNAEVHDALGETMSREGRTADALGQYEEALRADPNDARAHFDRGNALVQSGQLPAAIGEYEAALRSRPGMVEASNNLGVVLCRTGRVDEGMRRIEEAIRLQPDYAQAHFSRGVAMLQSGRKEEAMAEFNRVLELRPNDPAARRMLGMIHSAP
jgi:protein O-mannosyl-transferase